MTSPVILSKWYYFERLIQHCKTQTHIAILIIKQYMGSDTTIHLRNKNMYKTLHIRGVSSTMHTGLCNHQGPESNDDLHKS